MVEKAIAGFAVAAAASMEAPSTAAWALPVPLPASIATSALATGRLTAPRSSRWRPDGA